MTAGVSEAFAWWLDVVRVFPKMLAEPHARAAMRRVGVDPDALRRHLRGGARRSRPARPERDKLHGRPGSPRLEARRYGAELAKMNEIALRDAANIDVHELPADEHLLDAYLEILCTQEALNGGFWVCEGNTVPDPAPAASARASTAAPSPKSEQS